jgi:hypothetical protein
MRLNLGCGGDVRKGYVNIDLAASPTFPPDLFRQGDVGSLDWVCPEGGAEEILALDVIRFLPWTHLDHVINGWISRLAPAGTIKILTPDLHQIAQRIANDLIDLPTAQRLLFGEQRHAGESCRSAIDAHALCQGLIGAGMTIAVKRYDNGMFYVEAIKGGRNV